MFQSYKIYVPLGKRCDCNNFQIIKGGMCDFKIQEEANVFSIDLKGC